MGRIRVALNVVAIASIAVISVAAHPQAQKPSFEVTSVKANISGGTTYTGSCCEGGYFKHTNDTLKHLILVYYNVQEFQLVGGPDWINTSHFDVEARASTADVDAKPKSELFYEMVQSLIESRFQLKFHHETKDVPVLTLVVGKGGIKFQTTVDGRPGPGGLTAGATRNTGTPTGIELSGSGITINRFMEMVSSRIGRPIIDKTNLTDKYDFTLKFAPSSVSNAATVDPIGPDVFTAIQEQLGLRLEGAKGPVDVMVIDSVQKPTVN